MNNFTIFKAEKKNDKSPDYVINTKIGEEFKKIGGCWIKDGKNGKFFSCQLDTPYKDRPGFELSVIPPNLNEKVEEGGNPDAIPF